MTTNVWSGSSSNSVAIQVPALIPISSITLSEEGFFIHNLETCKKESSPNDFVCDLDAANVYKRPSVIRWARENRSLSSNKVSCTDHGAPQSDYASQHTELFNRYQEQHDQAQSSTRPVVNKETVLTCNQNRHRCTFCSKLFKWYSHWRNHERIHTGEKPFKCEKCHKRFARSDSLQCHRQTHMDEKSRMLAKNKGDNKALTIKDGDTLKQQDKIMKKKTPMKCNLCSRKFLSRFRLVEHIKVHNGKGKKKLKCDTCHQVFSKQSALEIHSRVHTGVKPFRCSVCPKAFTIHGNLKRHVFIHSGERPFICLNCPCTFNNRSHLTRHVGSQHADN